MQSGNFIKLLILLGMVTLGVFQTDFMIKYCCKYKTFFDDGAWHKCYVPDIGDNRAKRFCQMECVTNILGFSDRKNVDYKKLDEMITGLKAIDGQKAFDLHRNVADYCKRITDIQMKRNLTYKDHSDCSSEFAYFLNCAIWKVNEDCPKNSKILSYECKSQSVLFSEMQSNLDKIAKGTHGAQPD